MWLTILIFSLTYPNTGANIDKDYQIEVNQKYLPLQPNRTDELQRYLEKHDTATMTALEEDGCTLQDTSEYQRVARTVIRHIFTPDYDKHLIPGAQGADVKLELAIQSVNEINEISGSMLADILLSQIWHDERLRFDHVTNCLENLTLSHEMAAKLWLPNVCFVNSKETMVHESPSPNIFLMIYPNGTVWINYRLQLRVPCVMDMRLFPMDIQHCNIVLESYAYNSEKVRLHWWKDVSFISQTPLPDFRRYDMIWKKRSFDYEAGHWDQCAVWLFFSRRYGFYILQMYFPCYACVAMSWIAFWLDNRSLPARIQLGVSSLMALTFQYGSISRALPKVSYIKAIDVWLFSCIGFIFLSLCELAMVGLIEKERMKKSNDIVEQLNYEQALNEGTCLPGAAMSPLPCHAEESHVHEGLPSPKQSSVYAHRRSVVLAHLRQDPHADERLNDIIVRRKISHNCPKIAEFDHRRTSVEIVPKRSTTLSVDDHRSRVGSWEKRHYGNAAIMMNGSARTITSVDENGVSEGHDGDGGEHLTFSRMSKNEDGEKSIKILFSSIDEGDSDDSSSGSKTMATATRTDRSTAPMLPHLLKLSTPSFMKKLKRWYKLLTNYSEWTGYGIDSFCRRAFPASFALFNAFYWAYYMGSSRRQQSTADHVTFPDYKPDYPF